MFVVIWADYEGYKVLYVGDSKEQAWKARECGDYRYGWVIIEEWKDGKMVEEWEWEI